MKTALNPLLIFSAAMLISACATAPPVIRNTPPGPALVMVQNDLSKYLGQTVRWGGAIAAVDNKVDHTVIQIVARPLYSSGRPLDTSNSPGRFIAKVPGFVEPTEYKQGREITVVGKVAGVQAKLIGEHPYNFPVIDVSNMYLWEEEPLYDPYPYPYYGYPYYWDPFYPWGYGYYHFRYYDHPRYYPRYYGHPRNEKTHKHGDKYKK
jgi:outer membrane lipoprotein